MYQRRPLTVALLVGSGLLCVAWAAGSLFADGPTADAKPAAAKPAAGKPTDDSPKKEADVPANPAAAQAKFDEALAQFKAVLGRLNTIRSRFGPSEDKQRMTLIREYEACIAEGDAALARAVSAAEQIVLTSPTPDKKVIRFLSDVAIDAYDRDEYEKSARLARLLADHGAREGGMLDLAGSASFDANDFDAAKKYFKMAGALDSSSQRLGPQLRYYDTAWPEELKLREAEAKADDLPRVKLHTRYGDIVVELFENEAPNTVANFISLVEKGFYNGLTFHWVMPGVMAQGGCPLGNGHGGPGYTIASEATNKVHRNHFRGSLAMANQGEPDSGGSQFMFTFIPIKDIDGKNTVFGRIISGTEVLSKLQRRDPNIPQASAGDKIIKATVIRKRNHKYEPRITPEK